MGPVTAWAGRVEIMPSLPAFGYSTKLCIPPVGAWIVYPEVTTEDYYYPLLVPPIQFSLLSRSSPIQAVLYTFKCAVIPNLRRDTVTTNCLNFGDRPGIYG